MDSSTITLRNTGKDFLAISSPNYPENYTLFLLSTFIIRSPRASYVELIFHDLSIENFCRYDRLNIYDGRLYFTHLNHTNQTILVTVTVLF